jgi:hypothetical protein
MQLQDLNKYKKSILWKGIRINFETFTRPKADEVLIEHNLNNRKLSQRRGEYFAELLKSDNFIEDGNPIKFDKNDTLIDGQHRLLGISLSGLSRKLLTVRGLEPEVFVTIDDYKSRNFDEVLRILNVKEYTNMATIIKHKYLYQFSKDFRKTGKIYYVNPINLIKYMKTLDLDDLLVDLKFVTNLQRENGIVGAGIGTFVYSELKKLDLQSAQDFFTKFYEGYGLEKGDPILKARQFFIKLKNENYKIGRGLVVKAFFHTWNMNIEKVRPHTFAVPNGLESPLVPKKRRGQK